MSLMEEADRISTDIPQRLDRLPWSRWHTLIVVALGVTWILDGLEVTIVGAIGPVLTHSQTLGLTESQVGLTATSYLLGTVFGAILFSYLTDRQGRKKWFMATLCIYLIFTLLSAFSWNFWSFIVFRFFAGAGIGGEYSAINSAIDELIPARVRGHTDLAINGSWWIGTLIGALISIPLLDPTFFHIDTGWRICFGLGAILGLAIIMVRRWVPESPRWMVVHGQVREAEKLVSTLEIQIAASKKVKALPPAEGKITLTRKPQTNLLVTARQLFQVYPKRTVLGLVLMTTQSILYNAIFFSYAMILHKFYGVREHEIGHYIIPFAIANFSGPLLLGRLFDTVGRRIMIAATYGISGLLLAFTSYLFAAGYLNATTQTLAWAVIFFFASAGASAAYLTVSEIFPLEIRAMAIAFFFVIAQGVASASPWLFGLLIEKSYQGLALGNIIAACLMIAGAIVAYKLGVNAERRSLEEIALPLSAL